MIELLFDNLLFDAYALFLEPSKEKKRTDHAHPEGQEI